MTDDLPLLRFLHAAAKAVGCDFLGTVIGMGKVQNQAVEHGVAVYAPDTAAFTWRPRS